ncbi:hypothetical protein [Prosthecobacter sp.]|uniref:hypothetical protein n=1 Tax=Prosthecobacter sp. TaxID=1965333 RepID=UPI001D6F9B7A|nr:hypothetical protein [Prosthecobacter sp.]MCB1275126.1 hypothetical protein [Prosthecobacter sp.]
MFRQFRHDRALRRAYDRYDADDYADAARLFQKACEVLPFSWEAQFGLGVVEKWLCHWEECLVASLNSTRLRPDFEGSWWNVGIAATALSQWRQAREAWCHAGVQMEVSDEPVELKFGNVPIRLKTTNNEVLWCRRLDPARARIENVPTEDSLHRCGDLLLIDGEPVGTRKTDGEEVPVFNELQILARSKMGTFVVEVNQVLESEIKELCKAESENLKIEDWSTLRILCRKCSEGTPHEQHDHEGGISDELPSSRKIAFAALSRDAVIETLSAWHASNQAGVGDVECLIEPCA